MAAPNPPRIPGTLPACWKAALAEEFAAPYMADLHAFLLTEKGAGKVIFPPSPLWFHALERTPLERVRVVILGQDPYHGAGQAHGLCFSVPPGVRPPPSLVNIFKELHSDLDNPRPPHGCLTEWADQGVLMLNSVLTVEQGRAASHQGRGWELFTDAVIRAVAARAQPTAFLLWGNYAQKKAAFVARYPQHLVLKSVHPSPLSAYNGWFGSKPFSQANAFLTANRIMPVDWTITDLPLR